MNEMSGNSEIAWQALKEAVTIVIPARNEGRNIGDVLEKVSPLVHELIVVDGSSTDETVAIARKYGAQIITDNGKGKGDAIRCAIPHLRTPITVFMDADGSHLPEDTLKLVAPILRGEADHVSASRLLGGSSELHGGFDEFFRLAGSSLVTACINWKFGVRLSDSQNGFRAIRTDILPRLGLKENITTIEQEMVIKTLRKGYRMSEVPSHEYPRRYGQSSIRLNRVWHRYLWSLVKHLFWARS
jgi:dolichol-phosphate mannosyltransferase